MQRHRLRQRTTARLQRGGMSLTLMFVMLGLVLMLGLVEIGYLYWAKRDAQKVADLAALAGAQQIHLCAQTGNTDNTAARSSALQDNAFTGAVQIQCGTWDAANTSAPDHFSPGAPTGSAANAVKVVASRGVIPFFGINESLPTVSAQAVAKRSVPMAVFSVGSQLVRINGNTPLGNTLRTLGLDVNDTTLLDYNGLAGVHITPGGLLEALGIPVDSNLTVAGLNQKLVEVSNLSLGRLLEVTADLVGQDGVAKARVDALASLLSTRVDLNNLQVKLGSEGTNGGLFAHINAPDGSADSALNADVDVLDLLNTAISVATSNNAVAVNRLNILGNGVNVEARVVEPASIGIGGVGATAYNAQVRTAATIDTNGLPIVGLVTGALGIRLKLPVYADATTATGEITGFQCNAQTPTVTLRVTSNLLQACVGSVPESARFSKIRACDTDLGNDDLLTLLGTVIVHDKINVPVFKQIDTLTLKAGETGSTSVNHAAIGDTAATLTNELLRVLSNILTPSSARLNASQASLAIAERYLAASSTSGQKYNIESAINLLRNGNDDLGLRKLRDQEWILKNSVPKPCLLGLGTCYEDGPVFDSFKATVTNTGQGLLGSVLGGALGGLLIDNCTNLLGGLFSTYNDCVKRNLAKYIQTNPDGISDPNGGDGVTSPDPNDVQCSGLLCALLNPALELLKPILNSIGQVVSTLLTNVLGIELGRTDVHVQSIQCSTAQLVY